MERSVGRKDGVATCREKLGVTRAVAREAKTVDVFRHPRAAVNVDDQRNALTFLVARRQEQRAAHYPRVLAFPFDKTAFSQNAPGNFRIQVCEGTRSERARVEHPNVGRTLG